MIGIVNRAIAIPVCWRVLDKAGNSNTKERIAILEHVLRLFGVDKIASLLADREFIGDAWLAWLQNGHRYFKYTSAFRFNSKYISIKRL